MEVGRLRVLADPAADLDETDPQGVQLEAGDASLHEFAAQRVEQPVGGGMKQEAELIRQKRWQLRRSAKQASLRSLIQSSGSPRRPYQL